MRIQRAIFYLFLAVFFGASVAPCRGQFIGSPYYVEKHAGAHHVPLDGAWQLGSRPQPIASVSELQGQEWLSTRLPGSVQMAMYHAGKLPDPYQGMNSKLYARLDESVWYYRTSFELPQLADGENATLCFDGVDYYARVWVNGHLLGEHEGMLGGPTADIRKWINAEGKNDLVVEVKAANWGRKATYEPRNPKTVMKPWSFAGGTSGEAFFPFGIWRPVRIELTGPLHIERPQLVTESISTKSATLRLSVEIGAGTSPITGTLHRLESSRNMAFSNAWTAKPVPGSHSVEVIFRDGTKIAHREIFPVELVEGRNWLERTFTVENPQLWWPNGMGDPHLYQVEVRLLQNSKPVDLLSMHYGIRTLETIASAGPRTQDFWEQWQFVVNGKPFFVKGVDWMSADLLYNLPRENYAWLLGMAQASGVRLIRAWGGALVETDDFFEECDQRGLLVWQEFPLSNMLTAQWPQQVWEDQVAQNVFRLRNHPSLAVWCAGNESNPYAVDNAASVGIFERTVREFDPTRPYRRTSPDGGSVHEYPDMDPTWYGKLYQNVPFIAETGIHNIPASIKNVVSPKEFEKPLSGMYTDAFTAAHPEFAHHFIEFYPNRVPRMLSRASQMEDINSPSIDTLAESTQIGAGEFYQIASEQVQDNYPVTTGIIFWVFKRSWPTIAIEMVDGFGQPTAPYYFVRRTYEPEHVSLKLPEILWAPGEKVPLSVNILSSETSAATDVTVRVFDPSLKETWTRTAKVPTTPASVKHIDLEYFTIPDSFRENFFFLTVESKDAHGRLISSSTYWPRCLKRMEDAEFRTKYRASPQPALTFDKGPWLKPQLEKSETVLHAEIMSETPNENGLSSARIMIRNVGPRPSVFTQVDLQRKGCVFYSTDNFFWLSQGEERVLNMQVKCDANASAEPGMWTVSSWNAASEKLLKR